MRTGEIGGRGAGYELIEEPATVVTDVFVNGHDGRTQRDKAEKETRRTPYIIAGEMGK